MKKEMYSVFLIVGCESATYYKEKRLAFSQSEAAAIKQELENSGLYYYVYIVSRVAHSPRKVALVKECLEERACQEFYWNK